MSRTGLTRTYTCTRCGKHFFFPQNVERHFGGKYCVRIGEPLNKSAPSRSGEPK